jgi:CRISPR-associated endonuclease/helicase Cas3
VESAALAAKLHDEGKRDPRFQAMLWGGDHRKAQIASQLIAKSGMSPGDRAAHRRASRLAGYPSGMRHEALSAQIAALSVAQHDGVDSDLVLHLVAAHHGYGRPLLPPVVDQSPQKVTVGGHVLSTEHTVDWDGPARFAKLNRQYGRWGLALLETVVRLADIWCSARDLGEETTDAPD